jgi:hypothetical protein
VEDVENLDLMIKLIFVQIVAIELQGLERNSKKSSSFYIPIRIISCVIPKIAITKSGNRNAIMKNGFSPFFMRLEEPIQFFQSRF